MYLVVVWQSAELAWWTTELRVTAQLMAMRSMMHWPTMVLPQLLHHFSVYVLLRVHGVLQHFASQ